ncbi:MAG TPA: putative nucleotidyltransferase substrate binding domain-containing protein [Rhodocyclaceae bacterium]|nr:putative nucleotidyltransferase substrate binding domain-containing protein [Rhodocyclaceae bacterium]
MADENDFFRPVSDFCQRKVVTCVPDACLVDVVGIMRDKNISSVVVCEGNSPAGIITDRDLRNKVVAPGKDPKSLRVADIMNAPLSVIGEDDVLYEALYRMSRQGIHRLGVVDSDGKLAGIITDTDILRLQAHSPHQLVLDIEKAGTLDELKTLHRRIQALVLHLSGTGIRTRDMVRLIANLNDQILLRLIGLLREDRFAELPSRFAFIVLGSEGRSEQTLSTDQDNALIYADDLSEHEVGLLEEFSTALIDSLIEIGVPPCPGGIMAKNAEWRKSLDQWKHEISRWFDMPVPEHILQGSMLLDARTIYGDPSLVQDLKSHIYSHLERNQGFLMRMAKNMMGFAPPLGWFGRIKTERKGEHRGMLEIKKAGIFAITDGIKSLALQVRKLDGGTHERIAALVAAGVLTPLQAGDIEESFEFLVHLRLRGHVQAVRDGRTPTNYIALDELNRMEQARLRSALEGVAKFQEFVRHHFNLHLLQS